MKTQHTPGPWAFNSRQIFADSKNHGEAAIAYIQDLTEAEANARLIATAPELLEALESIENMAGHHEAPASFKHVWREAILTAQAAIKKAKGE